MNHTEQILVLENAFKRQIRYLGQYQDGLVSNPRLIDHGIFLELCLQHVPRMVAQSSRWLLDPERLESRTLQDHLIREAEDQERALAKWMRGKKSEDMPRLKLSKQLEGNN